MDAFGRYNNAFCLRCLERACAVWLVAPVASHIGGKN